MVVILLPAVLCPGFAAGGVVALEITKLMPERYTCCCLLPCIGFAAAGLVGLEIMKMITHLGAAAAAAACCVMPRVCCWRFGGS
jgi:hypothetical protein